MKPTVRYALGLATATVAYLLAALLANVLTDRYGQWPVLPGFQVTAGTYAAGVALLARDFVQRWATIRWGLVRGRWFTVAVIPVAAFLSWVTTDNPKLAAASGIAFAGGELVDFAVFTPMQQRWGFARAALTSNIVAAPVDTLLFLWLAGFPVTVHDVTGQFIGKVLWATLIPLAIWGAIRWWRSPMRRNPTLWDQINADLGR